MSVLAVGAAAGHPRATSSAENLSCISVDDLVVAERVCGSDPMGPLRKVDFSLRGKDTPARVTSVQEYGNYQEPRECIC